MYSEETRVELAQLCQLAQDNGLLLASAFVKHMMSNEFPHEVVNEKWKPGMCYICSKNTAVMVAGHINNHEIHSCQMCYPNIEEKLTNLIGEKRAKLFKPV